MNGFYVNLWTVICPFYPDYQVVNWLYITEMLVMPSFTKMYLLDILNGKYLNQMYLFNCHFKIEMKDDIDIDIVRIIKGKKRIRYMQLELKFIPFPYPLYPSENVLYVVNKIYNTRYYSDIVKVQLSKLEAKRQKYSHKKEGSIFILKFCFKAWNNKLLTENFLLPSLGFSFTQREWTCCI